MPLRRVPLRLPGFAFAGLAANKTVNIRSTGFAPKTVTIAGGDTVTWKNVDTVNHQVVANSGAFASGQIALNRILREADRHARHVRVSRRAPSHAQGNRQGDRRAAARPDRGVDADRRLRKLDPCQRSRLPARGSGQHG